MNDVKVSIRTELTGDAYRQLEKLARKHNVTVGQILADLGSKLARVESKKTMLARGTRIINESQEHRIVELYNRHYSDREISEEIGIDRRTVANHRNRLGLISLRRPPGASRTTEHTTNQKASTTK